MQALSRAVLNRFEMDVQTTVDACAAKKARQAFARVLLKDYYMD
jgi:hypothetical protein